MEPSHTALLIAIIAGRVITVLAFVYMTVVVREAIRTTRAVAGLLYQEEEGGGDAATRASGPLTWQARADTPHPTPSPRAGQRE